MPNEAPPQLQVAHVGLARSLLAPHSILLTRTQCMTATSAAYLVDSKVEMLHLLVPTLPYLHCCFTFPETCFHAGWGLGTGEVDIILAALQASVLVGSVERERPPLGLPFCGVGVDLVLEVVSAATPALGSAKVRPLLAATAVAHVRLRQRQLEAQNCLLALIVQGAVPAALVTLRMAVVEAPAFAGGVLRGRSPQRFQTLMFPFPVLLSPAFVVPAAAMQVVGIPGSWGILAGWGNVCILITWGLQRVALGLAKSHLQISELAGAWSGISAAGRG